MMMKNKLIYWLLVPVLYTLCVAGSLKAMSIDAPLIFPIPQKIEFNNDMFKLDETVSILVPENAADHDLFLARFLVRELSDKYGIALKVKACSHISSGEKAILMGSLNNTLVKKYCDENKIKVDKDMPGPEGYVLQISQDRVVIAGCDDAGAFWGLQSLRQLLIAGDGTEVQGLDITDWPVMPFRGIRLYVPGPENNAFFRRFLRDFMALYKYNKVIVEINSMRLDRHPEVNAGWIEFARELQYSRSNSTLGLKGEEKNSSHYDAGDGYIIEKDDVRDMVEYANENFIEVIPEIPSLTHAYYLLTRHPELAEYPGDIWPDTYCPSNPASYELMFDVYDEYIEVIQPEMVHVGHDEWWGAPLGVCPRCKDKNSSELFAQDINKIHTYFAEKGIKIAMWGDYLLESVRDTGYQERVSSIDLAYRTPGAVSPEIVRNSIPKDILIFNWFWKDIGKEQELQNFGFKQVYGNFKPSIGNWEERIKNKDMIGGAPSSWASTNEFNFGKDLVQDFLGSANFLWSSHVLSQPELSRMVRKMMPDIRAGLNGKRIPSEDGDPVVPVDISSGLNFSSASGVFGMNLKSMTTGEVRQKKKVFRLSGTTGSNENSLIAVGVKGSDESSLPDSAKGVTINEDVSSLIFLHACARPAGNQKAYFNIPNFFDSSDLLGWYEVIYEDGYRESVPVQYGVNILEWNIEGAEKLDKREGDTGSAQNTYCYEAEPVDCSVDMEKSPITFFAYEWVNPRFGKKVKEVNLHGSVNYQALQQVFAKPVTEPMSSNAIILGGISKVIKREPFVPKKADE